MKGLELTEQVELGGLENVKNMLWVNLVSLDIEGFSRPADGILLLFRSPAPLEPLGGARKEEEDNESICNRDDALS